MSNMALRAFRIALRYRVGDRIVRVERGRLRLHRVFAEFHTAAQHGGDGVGKRGEQFVAAFAQYQSMEFHVQIVEFGQAGSPLFV